jgi:hypothetical protein
VKRAENLGASGRTYLTATSLTLTKLSVARSRSAAREGAWRETSGAPSKWNCRWSTHAVLRVVEIHIAAARQVIPNSSCRKQHAGEAALPRHLRPADRARLVRFVATPLFSSLLFSSCQFSCLRARHQTCSCARSACALPTPESACRPLRNARPIDTALTCHRRRFVEQPHDYIVLEQPASVFALGRALPHHIAQKPKNHRTVVGNRPECSWLRCSSIGIKFLRKMTLEH